MRLRTLTLCLFCWLILTSVGQAAEQAKKIVLKDSANQPIRDAVIFVQAAGKDSRLPAAKTVVDQLDSTFVPHVTAVQTGAEVMFANSDTVSHHVYSFAQGNTFELPLYKGAARPTIAFKAAGIVTLGCNIHDSMLGYIVVVDTPYFAVTNANGEATLPVPNASVDGKDILIWSPQFNSLQLNSARSPDRVNQIAASGILELTLQESLSSDSSSTGGSLNWDEY